MAVVGEQVDHRRFAACPRDLERLGRDEALLDRVPVGQERRHGEVVRPDLVIGVAERGAQEQPVPVRAAAETMVGLFFMARRLSLPVPGCEISTCGSF